MSLGKSQQAVLRYLQSHPGYHSPTELGHEVGQKIMYGSRLRHSSWASPICLRLVALGLVIRNSHGHYAAQLPLAPDAGERAGKA